MDVFKRKCILSTANLFIKASWLYFSPIINRRWWDGKTRSNLNRSSKIWPQIRIILLQLGNFIFRTGLQESKINEQSDSEWSYLSKLWILIFPDRKKRLTLLSMNNINNSTEYMQKWKCQCSEAYLKGCTHCSVVCHKHLTLERNRKTSEKQHCQGLWRVVRLVQETFG